MRTCAAHGCDGPSLLLERLLLLLVFGFRNDLSFDDLDLSFEQEIDWYSVESRQVSGPLPPSEIFVNLFAGRVLGVLA